ncbi:MAG: N-acetyltransferase [Betaproteobacteria bacterium]|nr:N-acetyltransferase [Betaproteobacteria bacterium]
MYFAESPDVAKTYIASGSRPAFDVEGAASNLGLELNRDAQTELRRQAKTDYDSLTWLQSANKSTRQMPVESLAKVIEQYRDATKPTPSLYKVDIPDNKIAQMLDWDKPLSQQSSYVQDALRKIPKDVKDYIGIGKYEDLKGGIDILKPLGGLVGDAKASEMLRQAGIPGIRYLDEGSRAAGKGTSNFVVFPGEEESIKMLEINNAPPMKKGGAVRISDNPDTILLELMKAPRFQDGGVSSLKGYGEGREDVEKALQAIKESAPVSAMSQLASGYMSGAGGTDLEKIGQAASMLPMIGLPATIGKAARAGKASDVISDALRAKYPDVDISLAGDKQLNLSKIVVPKEMRGQGMGTQVMNDLVRQADEAGASVSLSPSADFGGNKERLKDFYKRFGFVENKGKNKDFSISESMYREPIQQKPSAFKAPQDKALLEAQRAAALPVEQGGLGLPLDNTPDMRAAAMGYQDFYHGTERLDRLLEKSALDPRRATSGPMPYGTESKQMASVYASNKRDTSRLAQDEGNVADYFTVSAKNLGYRFNKDIPVEKAFYLLPREKQQEIISKVKRIGYANPQEATGNLVLHPEGAGGSIMDPKTIDYYLQREAKGNPLTALRIIWHDSGTLYNNEEQLARVFELAGFPFPISQKNAPWSSAQGVLTGKAKLDNPLVTTDTEVIESKVIPALKQAFAKDKTRKQEYGPDQWAKNVRFTPKEWVEYLEKDMAKGKNSYVWTSIPDKVTAELRKLGFDGIVDAGGKGGGAEHRVIIPFDTKQVRSRFAAFNPLKKDEPGLLKKKGGKVHVSNNLETMRLELLRKKYA